MLKLLWRLRWLSPAGISIAEARKKNNKDMLKNILRIIVIIVITLVSGIIGLVIGALIGGNYAQEFVFDGVKGYEATGQLGFILGVVAGLLLSAWFMVRRKK